MKKRLGIDYDDLFHSIPGDYVVIVADDPRFTIVEVSDTFCQFVNMERDDVLEKPFRDVFPMSDDKESNEGTKVLIESFRECIRTKQMHDAGVVRYDVKSYGDGEFTRKLWMAKSYPILRDLKPVGLILSTMDVTTLFDPDEYAKARIAHLEYLVEINQSKDEFISIASHQLRTPATGVKQYLGMVLEGFFGDLEDSQRNALERAYENNERQLRIVTDLLKVAQVDAGKVVLRREPIALNDYVADIAGDWKEKVAKRNQVLVFRPADSEVMVSADPETLRMVVENVLDNASKYTSEGKRITLCIASTRDQKAAIRVIDEGIGIPDEKIDRLFEKFWRMDNEMSAKIEGTGLGLYWAKKIIDLHGGDIRYRHNRPHGSVFDIVLPKQKVM